MPLTLVSRNQKYLRSLTQSPKIAQATSSAFWTLQSHGSGIQFCDINAETPLRCDGPGPQQHAGIGDGQPVLVVLKLQENKVVYQRTLVITHPYVFALTHGELRHITR